MKASTYDDNKPETKSATSFIQSFSKWPSMSLSRTLSVEMTGLMQKRLSDTSIDPSQMTVKTLARKSSFLHAPQPLSDENCEGNHDKGCMGKLYTSNFPPFQVVTMTHPGCHPRFKWEARRLHPDMCFCILSVTAVGKFGAYYDAGEASEFFPVTMKIYRPQAIGRNHASFEKNILLHRSKPDTVPDLYRFFSFELYNVLVLERLSAHSLQMLLKTGLRFTNSQALSYFYQMLEAVSFLHSMKIIHGSLKLDSFWLQDNDMLKLTDFSNCKRASKAIFHFYPKKLNDYTAPELLTRGYYSKMIDVWSLGVILYRMVSGVKPFYASTPKALSRMITTEKEQYNVLFSTKTQSLCSQMLMKMPSERPGYEIATEDGFSIPAAYHHESMDSRRPTVAVTDFEKSMFGDSRSSCPFLRLSFGGHKEYKKHGLKMKPLRFKEITSSRANDLFDERNLLKQNSQMQKFYSEYDLLQETDKYSFQQV